MPNVAGIRFKNCGKVYDFEVNDLELRKGSQVVIESEFGLSIGKVVSEPRLVDAPHKELKKVLRLASEEDYRQKQENEQFERDAKGFCHERIMARGLPMKLVCAEAALDKKRIVFYFTADGRIDFRELVKDLAAKFKTRIEMRQIGVRDKAKLVGGYSICGKELCCRLFLTTFEPISIKMAKQQDLSLNTGKLSGACGRLMCCLGYEYHEDSAPTPVEVPSGTVQAGEVQSAALAEGPEPEGEDTAPPEEQAGDKTSGTASGAEPQVQDHHRKRRRRRRHRKRLHKHE